MSEGEPGAGPTLPDAREQINGLSFALLLLAPDHVIHEANPASENLLGLGSQRMVGRSFLDVLTFSQSAVQKRFAENDAQLVARGVDAKVGERMLRLNITLSTPSSHPGWRIATLSDASQGERFGAQGSRTQLRGPAVLAHEIKNPLAAIRGASQLLARKADESQKPLTALIADEVDRIAQLIDRMQRLGRERAEPIKPVNLHAAIHRAYETVRISSAATVAWGEEFDPSLPPVLANEGALVQVLVNLMANARDACASSVAPQVKLRTRFVSGIVWNVIRLGRPVKLPIEIQVSDNGPGIDPAVSDDIFEPFVSTKTNGQGLGLALVQKLVRDMDGRVSHERDEDGGWTHFRIHLPMAR
ncbi:two-component system sensor histidine kinase NtrB [Aurantiacibacter poecillastricola]|uniref:two-component system sensor histidine kinase NtrB n=1 Tax=Aurantiacibacter poecillastricola TaxID=3064385 RepID=UPI00273F7467|nr:ATP-binding protein [Aurantiacibacter sp. 219JJ12-13]MDP5261983.1 ATP-binding protein [Aurantiacibacter sp. 219JJ12-13]